VDETLTKYFRFPSNVFASDIADNRAPGNRGFFRFGPRNICYGRCRDGVAATVEDSSRFDTLRNVSSNGRAMELPFSFAEVIENLRFERYRERTTAGKEAFAADEAVRNLYSILRGWLPSSFRRRLQRIYLSDGRNQSFPAWPVDLTVENLHAMYLRLLMEINGLKKVPFIWFWPAGAPSCLIVTHDVETRRGRDFTSRLMDVDDAHGFKTSIQVVPEERYDVSDEYLSEIRSRGSEFNVHDLNHDGLLFLERRKFLLRAAKINAFAKKHGCRGFRAGSMYRNQDWYDAFEFSYDMSVPNVAHLDPMRGGCCTVMPYFVGKVLELPVTTAQDYTLFHILDDYSIDLWKQQLELIRQRNGLMSIITHPDYLIEERARRVYEQLLEYLRSIVDREKIWAALPGDVDAWWRARNEMKLEHRGSEWDIVGPGKERARLAYAVLDGDHLAYEIEEISSRENVFL
jgi:hypothetical protein